MLAATLEELEKKVRSAEKAGKLEETPWDLLRVPDGPPDEYKEGEAPPENLNYLNHHEVKRIKENGIKRVQRAKAQIGAQKNVFDGILTKVRDLDELHGDVHPESVGAVQIPSGLSSDGKPADSSMADVAEGFYSSDCLKNARRVSDEFLRRTTRLENHAQRRHEQELQEQQYRVALDTELHAAEARRQQRMEERDAQLRHTNFKKQQVRSEQQKSLRELQREQERVWANWYAKNHPDEIHKTKHKAASHPSLKLDAMDNSDTSPHSSPLAELSTATAASGIMSEEVMKQQLRSHRIYSSTMERWQAMVAENERRAETHHRKVMLGSNKKARSTISYLKRSIFRSLNSKETIASTAPSLHGGENASAEASECSVSAIQADTMQTDSERTSKAWDIRFQRCVEHNESVQQQREQTWERKSALVKEARANKKSLNNDIIQRLNEGVDLWKKRSQRAKEYRANAASTNADEVMIKWADWNAKRKEDLERQHQEMHNHYETKWNLLKQAQTASQVSQAQKEEKYQAHFQEKEIKVSENKRRKNEEFESNANSPVHAQKTQLKLLRKSCYDQEKRDAAKEEINKKLARSTGALERLRTGAIARNRNQRKRAPVPASLASETGEDNKLDENGDDVEVSSSPTSCKISLEPQKKNREDPYMKLAKSTLMQPLSHLGHYSDIDDMDESQLKRQTLRSPILQRNDVRRSSVLTQDPETEKEVLQELENQAGQWLKELRKQRDQEVKNY